MKHEHDKFEHEKFGIPLLNLINQYYKSKPHTSECWQTYFIYNFRRNIDTAILHLEELIFVVKMPKLPSMHWKSENDPVPAPSEHFLGVILLMLLGFTEVELK